MSILGKVSPSGYQRAGEQSDEIDELPVAIRILAKQHRPSRIPFFRDLAALDRGVASDPSFLGQIHLTEQLEPAPARTPSPGATRMKRLRERRLQGKVCFLVELDPSQISGLIELKWLPGSHRNDRDAVISAFCRFVGYALDMARNIGR